VAEPILQISNLSKTYKGGTHALEGVDLAIERGEIFALLGPNGAGKTTLIGAVCGLVKPSTGTIHAFGKDVNRHWREVRRKIGLVPQELAFDMFAQVDHSVAFSRGMFGCPPNPERIDEVLRSLSLYDKRKSKIRELSGGMKRRVMIAKALSHDPELLFLDELRRDMWRQIGALRDKGTTIILTTHYIEEAQEMADRVGVINQGKLLLVDDKRAIMAKLGRTEARIALASALSEVPAALAGHSVVLEDDGMTLVYRGGEDGQGKREAAEVIKAVVAAGIGFEGIVTRDSTLEDIFVDLVEGKEGLAA
jgi:ABC-2 type transport system ATP-binding protein